MKRGLICETDQLASDYKTLRNLQQKHFAVKDADISAYTGLGGKEKKTVMGKKKPTREDIIQALKELDAEGIRPGQKALKEKKGISTYWVGELIPEGLTELKLKLGLTISPQERPRSDDELLKKIDEVVSKLKCIPSWARIRRETGISNNTFINRFGKEGKPEVFSHYRKWLQKHQPESENIKLVDAYLEGQDKTRIPAESEVQDEKQILFKSLCGHCGNITLKSLIGSHKVEIPDQDLIEYELYRCQICEHVILRKGSTQLWPPPLEFPPEVPERITEIYEEARHVKRRSPSSFVVQIRRALEALTKERSAEGKVLNDKINWLIEHGQLPQVFGQMSHISRMIANLGAHDAERDVQPSDADIVDEFFRAIIEYIYIAPAKVARIGALIEK